ncbi:MAG: hypothetical protein VB067_05835 [Christensenellaceae bacterium]|nr:hypothetical protein [Christensenellaceae bacterium]MEA5066020.1 hypothetical protein [Eubacteriales bacterium]MEA5068489.1 hypothetical protein [Christensenellaceae bacterium]
MLAIWKVMIPLMFAGRSPREPRGDLGLVSGHAADMRDGGPLPCIAPLIGCFGPVTAAPFTAVMTV